MQVFYTCRCLKLPLTSAVSRTITRRKRKVDVDDNNEDNAIGYRSHNLRFVARKIGPREGENRILSMHAGKSEFE